MSGLLGEPDSASELPLPAGSLLEDTGSPGSPLLASPLSRVEVPRSLLSLQAWGPQSQCGLVNLFLEPPRPDAQAWFSNGCPRLGHSPRARHCPRWGPAVISGLRSLSAPPPSFGLVLHSQPTRTPSPCPPPFSWSFSSRRAHVPSQSPSPDSSTTADPGPSLISPDASGESAALVTSGALPSTRAAAGEGENHRATQTGLTLKSCP